MGARHSMPLVLHWHKLEIAAFDMAIRATLRRPRRRGSEAEVEHHDGDDTAWLLPRRIVTAK
jgi:hypothetical protein